MHLPYHRIWNAWHNRAERSCRAHTVGWENGRTVQQTPGPRCPWQCSPPSPAGGVRWGWGTRPAAADEQRRQWALSRGLWLARLVRAWWWVGTSFGVTALLQRTLRTEIKLAMALNTRKVSSLIFCLWAMPGISKTTDYGTNLAHDLFLYDLWGKNNFTFLNHCRKNKEYVAE